MTVEFRLRRDDGSWATNNTVLGPGEPGVSGHYLGIGDGHTGWNDLPKFLDQTLAGSGGGGGTPEIDTSSGPTLGYLGELSEYTEENLPPETPWGASRRDGTALSIEIPHLDFNEDETLYIVSDPYTIINMTGPQFDNPAFVRVVGDLWVDGVNRNAYGVEIPTAEQYVTDNVFPFIDDLATRVGALEAVEVGGVTPYLVDHTSDYTVLSSPIIPYPSGRQDGDLLVVQSISGYNVTGMDDNFEVLFADTDWVCGTIGVRVVDGTEGSGVTVNFSGAAENVVYCSLVRSTAGMSGYRVVKSGGADVATLKATALQAKIGEFILCAGGYRVGSSTADFDRGTVIESRDTDANFRTQLISHVATEPFGRYKVNLNSGTGKAGMSLIGFVPL